jgi:DNA repair photolyase
MEAHPPQWRKGRGAQINTANPYHQLRYDPDPDPEHELRTEYIEVHPKTILNPVKSPDIPAEWGMNPYQGCEHGCVYCYARNTHPYWGYSAGIDFEQKIMVKPSAPRLLAEVLRKPSWQVAPIMLAGNTDIYQPAEAKFQITRQLLEVLWKYRHPVGLITKNSLIIRDLDVIGRLASEGLCHASISITTLDEKLRRLLEPRTATIEQRFKAVAALTSVGVPVNVMIAPIIPGLTDHEILPIAARAAEAGAIRIGYTVVRLNDDVATIFEDWARKTYPDRADRILNRIRDVRNGNLGEKRFGKRHRGEGEIAAVIDQQFDLARRKFFADRKWPDYNLSLHEQYKTGQLKLF